MNGSAANKKHNESHDYDYDPLEVILFTSFNVIVSVTLRSPQRVTFA